jgi:hypothetical protein
MLVVALLLVTQFVNQRHSSQGEEVSVEVAGLPEVVPQYLEQLEQLEKPEVLQLQSPGSLICGAMERWRVSIRYCLRTRETF